MSFYVIQSGGRQSGQVKYFNKPDETVVHCYLYNLINFPLFH